MKIYLLTVAMLVLSFSVGCGDGSPGDPLSGGGAGGSAGAGGVGGTGGVGGIGGVGGVGGGTPSPCVTSVLCNACPEDFLCDSDGDCGEGSVCIESGCETFEGAPIQRCESLPGGACNTDAECLPEYECTDVGSGKKKCVKTTPGCSTYFDCLQGFDCEGVTCVDRRVPCDFDPSCPMNHLCYGTMNGRFCVRIQRTCLAEFDCPGIAPWCEDIDGDGAMECAGVFNPNESPSTACTNSMCTGPSAPVCEASGAGSVTLCGQYGLCLIDADCASGFDCVGLWPDGRKECVPSGGSCSSFSDCPIRQVCASPRTGGIPSCQVGFQPL